MIMQGKAMEETGRIVDKAVSGDELSNDEVAQLFEVPLFTPESAFIQVSARNMSHDACKGMTEVHAQIGLNVAPCPKDCQFCAFASCNGVFKESVQAPIEEVIAEAIEFERDGANALFLMATANYSMKRFFDVSKEVRNALQPETVMVANVGDFDARGAKRLIDAGYSGIYHAVRLGEGRDTKLDPQRRLETIEHAHQAGLSVCTCLEPVGPEHTIQELVEKTIITRDSKPAYSGSARRIPIAGTRMAQYGIVSEARMAHILAVVRLVVGLDVPGNCTHEPNVIGAAAGATLLWAESGSNPRDSNSNTKGRRGMTVGQCRSVLEEAEWQVLDGPSRMVKALG